LEYLGYLISILTGVTLGLIGGGGSILTIPVLVYLFKINPENATSYSLFIVGIAAMAGSYRHYKLGNLKIKIALIFAIPSVFSLLFVRIFILPILPISLFFISDFEVTKNILIMVVFAVLMIFASLSMIRKSTNESKKTLNYKKVVLLGMLIGLISGFLGAGGGFLIIPTLLFFGKIEMKQAVGTSLLIIAINSLIGFSGDLINGIIMNYQLLITITAFAIIGIFIGSALSKKIEGAKLKPAFGWFVLVLGIYIITKELFLK
jgi:uncharacterized protein